MGLFDRLFGKKEEPKIEEVVKEALENLDLSEDAEPALTEAEKVPQEDAEVESSEEDLLQEEENQETVEESQDSEPVVEVSQEEVEELPNSEEVPEEEGIGALQRLGKPVRVGEPDLGTAVEGLQSGRYALRVVGVGRDQHGDHGHAATLGRACYDCQQSC